MRPDLHSEKSKQIISMFDEYTELRDCRRGYVVEIEPYQRGWTRTFVLTDEAKLLHDSKHVQEALDLVNHVQFSNNQDFTFKRRKGEYLPMVFYPLFIHKRNSRKIPEQLMKYFTITKISMPDGGFDFFYIFNRSKLIRKDVQKNIITHQFIPDGDAESRLQYLDKKIWSERGLAMKSLGWRRGPDYGNFKNLKNNMIEQHYFSVDY